MFHHTQQNLYPLFLKGPKKKGGWGQTWENDTWKNFKGVKFRRTTINEGYLQENG
jgi:hypothetical protein